MKKKILMTICCFLSLFMQTSTFSDIPLKVQAAPYLNSKDLYKAHENNSVGLPIYNNQTISVQGIVSVDIGVWHDSASYFTITTEKTDYRFAGGIAVYLPGYKIQNINRGDKVVVTGVLKNNGYSSDMGTSVIIPNSINDITKLSEGHILPDAYPIFTNPLYEEVEKDPGFRFEGMPVRIMGVINNFDDVGTVRGFYVDGSRDGNYNDGIGAMNVKIYDYSSIDISNYKNGDYVIVEGILFQNDDTSPYTSGYYIRPTNGNDIKIVDENAELLLNEVSRKDNDGKSVLSGRTIKTKGVVTVDSGKWNNLSNAFTVASSVAVPGMDPVYPEGAAYVYAAGAINTPVAIGDEVSIIGTLTNNGYDFGLNCITPLSITINSHNNKVISEKVIRSDYGYDELKDKESMPVKLQGRIYNIDKEGVTQGFKIDASKDYNWTDKIGTMNVKFYNYSGIDLTKFNEGDLIILRGILQKSDTAAPFDSGYFVRPRNSDDMILRSEHTERTVFIQLDAFRNDYIGRNGWDTENMQTLIDNGSRCLNSYGEYVSMTTANMTTLVTGSHTSTHLVPALAFYDPISDRRVRNLQNYDVPTVGEVFQQAGLLTASVLQRKLQNRGADFMLDGGTIAQIKADAVNIVNSDDPDLLVVLFNTSDSVAHKYGTSSAQIKQAVEEIDDAIGSIKEAYRAKGNLADTTFIISSDHGMDDVSVNLTSALVNALQSTNIPFENAALDMGPFDSETKVVYNLASGAAQIYFRKPLTATEQSTLISALSNITGVANVYNRTQLDQMNTPKNLGDLVVDCDVGYAFSTSAAEHGSYAQRHTILFFSGRGIKSGFSYSPVCRTVDIVPTIYYLNGLVSPATVDGNVLTSILTD